MQEQPGKGEPGGEHQLHARQGTEGGPWRDAGRGKAPCLAGPGGHEADASVLRRAAGPRAGAWGRQLIAQKNKLSSSHDYIQRGNIPSHSIVFNLHPAQHKSVVQQYKYN